MSGASGSDRAGRSSVVTTGTSSPLHAAMPRAARAGAVGSGEPVVDMDPLGCDAEPGQGVALRSEVLLVGGDPGVADQQSAHRLSVRVSTPHRAFHRAGLTGITEQQRSSACGCSEAVPVGVPLRALVASANRPFHSRATRRSRGRVVLLSSRSSGLDLRSRVFVRSKRPTPRLSAARLRAPKEERGECPASALRE